MERGAGDLAAKKIRILMENTELTTGDSRGKQKMGASGRTLEDR
jgi:hypothetical protein